MIFGDVMSLGLYILPLNESKSFSHEILSFETSKELFNLIISIQSQLGRNVPEYFTTFLCRDDRFSEHHYGNTQKTDCGTPLLMVKIKYLLCDEFERLCMESEVINRAIYAYLSKLKPDNYVALYWH